MNNSFKPALLLLSLLGLAACGGGGGSDSSSPTPAPSVLDTDNDGTPNTTDTDDDNDGVLDVDDAFPLDAKEWADIDGDGVGNNSDNDKDGDGVANSDDAFPEDPTESADLDGDGVGNNSDDDIDGDQVPNNADAFPEDPSESLDTDGDGVGDNTDTDKDGNNIDDSLDQFQQQIFQLPAQVTGITDAVYHSGRNVFFIALKNSKSVIVVDADSGEIKQTRNFAYMSERLALSPDQSNLYVTLLSQEHVDYLPHGTEQEGRVAILDVNSLKQKALHNIDIDPFDIIATKDNSFVVSPGSHYSGSITSVDVNTGVSTHGRSIDSGSYLSYSPTSNHLYTSDSFNTLEKYDLNGGEINYLASSNFDRDAKVRGRVWVNPQSTKVITKGASLFDAEALTLDRALVEGEATIENVSYSPDGKSVVLSMDGAIALTFNGDTMQQVGQNSLFGELKYSASNGNFTYHITELNNSYSLIKALNPCAGCATNTAPKAEFTVTPAQGDTATEFVFDASLSSDLENSAQLSFRWDFDSDGEWDTGFSATKQQQKRFVIPGTKYVRLQVKDNLGALSEVTNAIEVSQGKVTPTAITGATANQFEFKADDSLALANNKALQIDKDKKRLYLIDLATGLAQHYYQFEYLPSVMHLDQAQQTLYLALDRELEREDREQDEPWNYIAVIDLTSNEWVKTLPLSAIVKDMVTAVPDRLFVLANGNYDANLIELNLNDGSEIHSESVSSGAKLYIDDDKSVIYALNMNYYTFYAVKYDISNRELTTGTDHQVRHNNRDLKNAWLSKDKKFFITNVGMVVSAETFDVISQIPLNQGEFVQVAYDDVNNLLFLLDSNNKVHYLNQDTFLPVGQVIVPVSTTQIYVVNNQLVLLMEHAEGYLELVRQTHPCTTCASNTVPSAQFSYTPEQGNTSNVYQFDASASSDQEDGSNLAYRWDFDSDGKFDSEFSFEATESHRYWLPGSYEVTLEARDTVGAVAKSQQTVTVAQGEIAPTAITNATSFDLDGVRITDQAVDKARNRIYLSDYENAKLYVYNMASNVLESVFELPFSPGKMAMNADQDKLHVILNDRDSTQQQTGYMASFDLEKLVWYQVFPVAIYPSSIQASAQHVFVGTGYNREDAVVAYSLATGKEVARANVNDGDAELLFSQQDNQLYVLNYSSIQKFNWTGQALTEVTPNTKDRVYAQQQGWLTPDGKTLLTRQGELIDTSDYSIKGRLKQDNFSISHAVFDPTANLIFALSNYGNIEYFNLDSFELVGELDHDSRITWFTIHDEKVTVIVGYSGRSTVDSFTYPCMACIDNTAPTAKFSFDSQELETGSPITFDASASSDPDVLNTLKYRWDFNSDGAWDTEFSSAATASHTYTLDGSVKVTVQVKDVTGTVAESSQLLTIRQGVSSGIQVSSSTAYEVEATANDFYFDRSRNKVYLTDYSAKKLYVVDMATGLTERFFTFEFSPSALAVTPDESRMYVALQTENANQCCVWIEDQKGYVAVFNLENTTWYDAFPVSTDPYDLVATDAGNVIITSGSGQSTQIQNYVASSGLKVGSANIYHRSVLSLHPEQNKVFAADRGLSPSDIEAFSITEASITSLGESPYHGDYKMWGDIWAMPDGNRVLTRGGDIFAASDLTYQDSLLSDYKRINSVWFDSNTITVGYDDEQGVEQFSLTSLSSIGSNDQVDAEYVFKYQGKVYYVEQDGATTKLKAVTLN